MIVLKYDESTCKYSVHLVHNKEYKLVFAIHKGESCSFWIEPDASSKSLIIGDWEISLSTNITTSANNDSMDSLEIPASHKGISKRIAITKKNGNFSDEMEICNSFCSAIQQVVERNMQLPDANFIDEEKEIIVSVHES